MSNQSLSIKVLFFASAREAAGNISSIQLELPIGSDTTVLRHELAERYPKIRTLILDDESITLAVNEEYISDAQILHTGDVVALIPPISGG